MSTTKATTTTKRVAKAAPAPAVVEATPAPSAPKREDRICALCGEGRSPKNEAVLPAALYLATRAVAAPFASGLAHVSCGVADRERHETSLLASAQTTAPRASRGSKRAAVVVHVPRSFDASSEPEQCEGWASVRIPRQAWHTLVGAANLYWGRLVVSMQGNERRAVAVVSGEPNIMRMVAEDLRVRSLGKRAGFDHSPIVSRSCLWGAERIEAALEAPAASTSQSFVF